MWHLATVLVSEDSPTQDYVKEQRKTSMVQGGEGGIDRVKKKMMSETYSHNTGPGTSLTWVQHG